MLQEVQPQLYSYLNLESTKTLADSACKLHGVDGYFNRESTIT